MFYVQSKLNLEMPLSVQFLKLKHNSSCRNIQNGTREEQRIQGHVKSVVCVPHTHRFPKLHVLVKQLTLEGKEVFLH